MKPSVALFTTLVTLTLVEVGFAGKRNRDRCNYDKPDWSACDTATNTMSRTLTLQADSGATCQATKTVTKPCRGGRAERCKYDKGAWSDCDVDTNTKTRTLTRKGGDESTCEATKTESKPCGGRVKSKNEKRKRGRKRAKNKLYSCQYSVAERSQCDDVTQTTTLTLTLKRGLPELCEQSKSLSRPCKASQENKKNCVYGRAEVSDCVDNVKTITRTLTDGDATECEATKTKTKKCREGKKARKDAKKERKDARKEQRKEARKERRQNRQDDTE